MAKLQAGDTFIFTQEMYNNWGSNYSVEVGGVRNMIGKGLIIREISHLATGPRYECRGASSYGGYWTCPVELIDKFLPTHLSPNQTIMSNLKQLWQSLTLQEPEKTFSKVGITDMEGNLTVEGKALYEQWRFEQDKAQFKTEVADKLLAEQEKKK